MGPRDSLQPRDRWAAEREPELWRTLQRDMHGKDYSLWLYNGRNAALGDRPPRGDPRDPEHPEFRPIPAR